MVTRRNFLKRSPLAALAFLLMPGRMLRWISPPASAIRRIDYPIFTIAENPMIRIAEIKQRRFDVYARSLNLEKVAA